MITRHTTTKGSNGKDYSMTIISPDRSTIVAAFSNLGLRLVFEVGVTPFPPPVREILDPKYTVFYSIAGNSGLSR